MQIPHDFPNDAPLPDLRPRCESIFDGKRCVRLKGHEQGSGKNPRHHIGADQSRWAVGAQSGRVQRVGKCSATFEHYRCDRWPHVGYHGVTVRFPEGSGSSSARLEWTGSGANACPRVVENEDRSCTGVERETVGPKGAYR